MAQVPLYRPPSPPPGNEKLADLDQSGIQDFKFQSATLPPPPIVVTMAMATTLKS